MLTTVRGEFAFILAKDSRDVGLFDDDTFARQCCARPAFGIVVTAVMVIVHTHKHTHTHRHTYTHSVALAVLVSVIVAPTIVVAAPVDALGAGPGLGLDEPALRQLGHHVAHHGHGEAGQLDVLVVLRVGEQLGGGAQVRVPFGFGQGQRLRVNVRGSDSG